jgi:hypothetical protein
MSKNPQYLTNDQVHTLNEKHGWFEFADAQSDVSRAFAQDAIAMHERIRSAAPDLLEALRDMLAGWKYIRSFHGDLYGVGWDRAEDKAEEAIAKATGAAA